MTISVALIGAGGIARDHVAAYARIPGVRVSHVVDTDASRARALATIVGNAEWAVDAAAVLSLPGVDAVDICTPSETHAALTIAAAESGKAIHVEKPAALSLIDFDAMVAATKEHGVSLMVGQTARFQPVNTRDRTRDHGGHDWATARTACDVVHRACLGRRMARVATRCGALRRAPDAQWHSRA